MIYSFSSKNRGSRFLDIEFTIENNTEDIVYLQLPAWRPGRYELANFAKNIQKFDVKTLNNKSLKFEKVSKDRWRVETKNIKTFKVVYNYYANELNAGSTWVDQDQIYVNPVNCCLYVEGREEEPVRVFIEGNEKDKVATGLSRIGEHFVADNFDELADSPFVSSSKLQSDFYYVNDVKFTLWFQGECKPEWEKLKKDFKAFTEAQLHVFGSFPFEEYHFIYQILPYKAYHGVEHQNSTMISYGPGYSIMSGADYEEILGVSSHELFHAWNVKCIRPVEMLPYDFTKENYTRLGFLTEGVTTYFGDLMLWKSSVFSEEQFLEQINKLLKRHFYNYGVNNMSVAESSFDTWLDGYVQGIPNRKGSIYTEGALLAFVSDLIIKKNSKGSRSLVDFIHLLFTEYGIHKIGVSVDSYFTELSKIAGENIDWLKHDFYFGIQNVELLLEKYLPSFGWTLSKEANEKHLASVYGIYTEPASDKILLLAPGSPGEKAGLNIGDEILSINGIKVSGGNSNHWSEYFNSKISIVVQKNGLLEEFTLTPSSKLFFEKREISIQEGRSKFF